MNHIGNFSTSGQQLIGVLLQEHDFINNQKAFVAKVSNLLYLEEFECDAAACRLETQSNLISDNVNTFHRA